MCGLKVQRRLVLGQGFIPSGGLLQQAVESHPWCDRPGASVEGLAIEPCRGDEVRRFPAAVLAEID
ncbi:MAG: hypothetical protein V1790_04500 [Planctomycetota bacterium]